ncbi:MAG: PGF-pre-PGF domain-containing protein, partial [Alphaproteobacteria bacterium]
IWVGNGGFATSTNIENAVLCFKVEKSWIKDKKIDKSSINLNRYNDTKWNCLPTSLLSEDDKYVYFTAETPGFSHFTITGKTTVSGTETQSATGNKTQSATGNKTQSASGSKTQSASMNETQAKPNAGNTAADLEQTPEQKQSPNSSRKGNTSMPAFDLVCGIVSLLAVFVHNEIKKK